MSASIENSLKDISRSLNLIAKELHKMNSRDQILEVYDDNSMICKCGECGNSFVAELPDNVEILIKSDNPYQE